jgi:hypothetical protein
VPTGNFTTAGAAVRGRDLSSLSRRPHEREIAFRPGSMLLPIDRFDVDDLGVAVTEEQDPGHRPDGDPELTIEGLKDEMRSAVRAARARPTVLDVTPGKFMGPLR